MNKPTIELKDAMKYYKYSAFGVRDEKNHINHIERPYLNITIFDKELAIEIGQILKSRLENTFKNAESIPEYQRARVEIRAFEEYLEGIKTAFPEIQFISTERKATRE